MDKKDIIQASKTVLRITNPLSYLLVEGTEHILETYKVKKDAPIEDLRLASEKIKIELSTREALAKVAQENSIAIRIQNAEEVQIEEFYDLSGKGSLDASIGANKVSAGLGASGSKVSKRIYTFKGNLNSQPIETIDTDDLSFSKIVADSLEKRLQGK